MSTLGFILDFVVALPFLRGSVKIENDKKVRGKSEWARGIRKIDFKEESGRASEFGELNDRLSLKPDLDAR